ncbi:MAG: molybdenum cofactor guanylyltransferase [Pelomonas sp.]|nr:molybdenum cofactor guanylyltransferase [Roseateles sp.]
MGGVDKGLQLLDGRPLVAHVIERLAPQAAAVLISANRHLDAYAAFGHPVLPDPPGLEFAGPLAGMLAGMRALPDDAWLLTAPCDGPYLPADLARRLLAAARPHGLAFARAARKHPTHALLHARLCEPLAAHLRGGGRAVLRWMTSRPHGIADFDDEAAFANLNHPADLHD